MSSNDTMSRSKTCLICKNAVELIFVRKILGKYDVSYFQCKSCQFVQTEYPYWLDEAYKSAITALDLGLATRSVNNTHFLTSFINRYFRNNQRFIDFGGGYGLTVRLMRDQGFDYYRQDDYCDNLFAQGLDVVNLAEESSRFELLTAFEVFEHLVDVHKEWNRMFAYSDTILFTTELIPESLEALKQWRYLIPETGQHISLFSRKSLEHIAQTYNLHLQSRGDMHLLSKRTFPKNCLKLPTKVKLGRKLLSSKHPSLIDADYKAREEQLRARQQ